MRSMNTQIYEEASEWVVRHRTDDLDRQARHRFDAWLRKSPQHVGAYLEMSSIWEGVPQIDGSLHPSTDELIERSTAQGDIVSLRQSRKPDLLAPVSVSKFLYSLAATLIVAVGIAGWFYLQRGVYATGVGEQRMVTLLDGSVIELNARSRIKVRYNDHQRSVDLLQGQALFHVAKNPVKPFIVASNGTYVRAVGTQFDVYRKSAGTVVTVVEGRVAVKAPSAGADIAPPVGELVTGRRSSESGLAPMPANPRDAAPSPNEHEVLLGAGEQWVVDQTVSSSPKPTNVEAATAWTQQRLVFDSTPLTDVAEEFNRYNHRRLVIEDSGLRTLHISGSFSSTDPTLLLRFLRAQPGILVNETIEEIRISRREAEAG
jgi:transmembrane sensor